MKLASEKHVSLILVHTTNILLIFNREEKKNAKKKKQKFKEKGSRTISIYPMPLSELGTTRAVANDTSSRPQVEKVTGDETNFLTSSS